MKAYLENVIDATEICRHSLMCRHVCPVGNLTRSETLTPHGWAQLVALERRGLSTWNEETVDALYKCADCGNCRAHCVGHTPLPEAIAAARAVVVEKGLAPAAVRELAARLGEWENPYERRSPEAAQGRGEAVLFVGDDAWHLRPSTIEAAVALLRAAGVDPVLIGKGRNNGYLASSLGLPGLARELAVANLAEISAAGARRVFVLSPGDRFTLTTLYPERLDVRVPEGVEVEDLATFLARQLEAGQLRLGRAEDATSYAYLDPTHTVREPSRVPAPRRLLAEVLGEPAREVFWREGRAYPTGNLALQFTQPQLADALTQARLIDAVEAGAEAVVTEAPGDLVHLERHAAAHGIRVQGLYEMLAGQLAT